MTDVVVIGAGDVYGGTDGDFLADLLIADPEAGAALKAVATLALPDAWIAAGFVRNRVWDRLHGFASGLVPADVDVVYFCRTECGATADRALEERLRAELPGVDWSVKNQARMHTRHGDRPYRSTADAMRRWPETATTVGVRLDGNGRIAVLAPFGLDDLFGMIVRPTPHVLRHRPQDYRKRLVEKNVQARWPRLHVLEA